MNPWHEDAVEAELISGPGLPIEEARVLVVMLDDRLPFREILDRTCRDIAAWLDRNQPDAQENT